MHERMAGNRAYLHPYRWTSLGLSLIEAMTIGMPVLALAGDRRAGGRPAGGRCPQLRPGRPRRGRRARWLADPGRGRAPWRGGAPARARPLRPAPVPTDWDSILEGGGRMKIAMVSEHASPLAALGGVDAGGQNVHVAALAPALAAARAHGRGVHPAGHAGAAGARAARARRDVVHVPAGPPGPLPQGRTAALHGRVRRLAGRALAPTAAPDVVHAHFWMSGVAALRAAAAARRAGGADVPRARHRQAAAPGRRGTPARPSGSASRPDRRRRRPGHRHLHRRGRRTAAHGRAGRDECTVVPCGVDLASSGPGRSPTRRAARAAPRAVAWAGWSSARASTTVIAGRCAGLPGGRTGGRRRPDRAELDGDPEVRRLRGARRRAGRGRPGALRRPASPRGRARADALGRRRRSAPRGTSRSASSRWRRWRAGVPVVATAVGGLLDTVVDGGTGLHRAAARPGRHWRRALRRCWATRALRLRVGVPARACGARYGWPRVAERHRSRLPRSWPTRRAPRVVAGRRSVDACHRRRALA